MSVYGDDLQIWAFEAAANAGCEAAEVLRRAFEHVHITGELFERQWLQALVAYATSFLGEAVPFPEPTTAADHS